MRDFIRSYWKIAAAFAAGAFFLSLLVGLISGNPFGVMLLRAILLSAAFAGLGTGARYVVVTYLPELLSQNTPSFPGAVKPEGNGEMRGVPHRVDIVLPGEHPGGPSAAESSPGTASVAFDGDLAPAAEGAPGDADLGEPALETVDDSEAGPGGAESEEESEALGEFDEEFAEELPPARSSPEPALESEDELDSLPDLASMEEVPDGTAAAPRSRAARAAEGATPGDALRAAVGGQDPATLARAIRTVLKKDEKG